jgi:hypothetical protein
MRSLRSIGSLLLLCALSAGVAFSQAVSASIVGTVTDSSGLVIAGAKITLTEVNTGVDRTGTTNTSGNYTFPNLPPGQYKATFEMTGFKRESKAGINLAVDTTSRVDAQLSPGNVSETIEVTAEAAVLKTDKADISSTVDAIQIQELPNLFNGNYQLMLSLVPGVSEPTEQHSQFFNASSSVQMNAYGQPRMANNYQIEGIDNNERTGLLQIMIPPKDAIQQVNVSTSNHDPELGRGTGAVSNVVLKSGTNQYHGAAYWNLQNSAMDTRSFFNPAVGHIAYNQVGGNIGGPIKKNKLFYFADYLKSMDHEANTNLNSIPSMPYRAGDFSGDPTHIVYDPFSADLTTINGVGRTPFPNNIIPTSRINPVAAKIFALLPAPNQTFQPLIQTNDYFALLPFTKTTDHVDVKTDYQATDKDRYSVRFSYEKPVIFQAPEFGDAGGPAQGAFEGTGVQRTYSTGITWDRMISPTLITQTRVGVAYYNNVATQSDFGKNDSTNVGIPGVNINDFTSGMVSVNFDNTYTQPTVGFSASLPWVRAETNIDFVNTWTKMAHNHTIKFGVDVRRLRDALLQDQTFSPRGRYTFGNNQTSVSGSTGGTGLDNEVASFLLGLPRDIARDVNTYFPSLRANNIFSFIADQWQVSPRLSASLGVRWELYPPMTPEHPGGFSNYNPFNNTLVIAGVGNNPMNMGMNYYKHYLAPRVGLAYRLTDGKYATVLRSGFGLSYTPFPDNTYAYNFPVRSNNEYQTAGGNGYTAVFLPSGQLGTFQAGMPTPTPVVVPSDGIIRNPDPTQAYFYIPQDYKNSYVLQWNFAVQQALPWNLNLDVAYVGSHGVDTPAQYNYNSGFVVGAGNAGQPYFQLFGRTVAETQFFQGFSSSFNSLQVKFDRRFTSGLTMTTAFTWQKAMDYQSGDDGAIARWYINPGRNYARADFDRTLNYVQSYVYRLPFGKGQRFVTHGPAAAVIGGWQMTGILTMRTGSPLTFTDGAGSVGLNASGNTQTPDQVGPINVLHGINTGNFWVDKAAFAHPQTPAQCGCPGVFGTMGRSAWSGPGQFRLDLGVSRWINISERWKMQIRGDTYNFTNTPFFSNPQTDFNNSGFGYVTGTVGSGSGVNGFTAARSVQLALKIQF